MAKPDCPTIIYPNGNEVFLVNKILIQWSYIINVPSVVYELYYTDEFDENNEPDWKLIAQLPSSTTSYLWQFGKQLRSSNCRIAIRSRSSYGERSDFSISANNFSLKRQKLITPTVINPLPSETYDRFIEIITDDSGIIGTYTQRSFYQMFYSSPSAKISSTLIAQNIQVGSDPVFWNIANLPAADYIIQIYLSDGDGNISDSVYIPITIKHEGFFIVDTVPPVGAIVINNDATFTNTRDVTANVVAYDAATGIHSMQLLDDGDGVGLPDGFSDIKTYTLSQVDAVKTVQLKLQDFGGNRNDQQIQNLFQNILNVGIIDVVIDSKGTAWAITKGTYQLYKITSFPSLVSTLTVEPTSLGILNSSIYVATKNADNTSSLLLITGANSVVLNTFLDTDSIINTMATLGSKLYIGMENGTIYSYDSFVFSIVQIMGNPIKYIFSDGNILYLIQKNNPSVYVFNGTTF